MIDITALVQKAKAEKKTEFACVGTNITDDCFADLCGFSGLKSLCLNNGFLSCVPDAIVAVSDVLEVIDFGYNRITSLSPKIGALNHLTELHLINNKLSELPQELSLLKNLKILALASNNFTEVPEPVYALTNLEVLWLSYNCISVLPDRLFNDLPNITRFTCGFNKLTVINPMIFKWKKLQKIVLKANQITYLPGEIKQLQHLTSMETNENPMVYARKTTPPFNKDSVQLILPLIEICLRALHARAGSLDMSVIPLGLDQRLEHPITCSVCNTTFFIHSINVVTFDDFAGEVNNPFLNNICSAKCVHDGNYSPDNFFNLDDLQSAMPK